LDSTATQTDHYSSDLDSPSWISENTANTTWTRNIKDITGTLVAQQSSTGGITFELSDLQGDVGATASSSGVLQSVTDYGEFGAARGGTYSRYGWLGAAQRATDPTTGLELMGDRVYSPLLGRFLQTDMVPGGNASSYDYAFQDPINLADTSGDSSGVASDCEKDSTNSYKVCIYMYFNKLPINQVSQWIDVLIFRARWNHLASHSPSVSLVRGTIYAEVFGHNRHDVFFDSSHTYTYTPPNLNFLYSIRPPGYGEYLYILQTAPWSLCGIATAYLKRGSSTWTVKAEECAGNHMPALPS
jgi:RHS repeat-associated protein